MDIAPDAERMKKIQRDFGQKLVEDSEKIESVEKTGDDDYSVSFNRGASWDCYREVITIAADNFKVVTEYEFLRSDTVRFTIEEKEAINANRS